MINRRQGLCGAILGASKSVATHPAEKKLNALPAILRHAIAVAECASRSPPCNTLHMRLRGALRSRTDVKLTRGRLTRVVQQASSAPRASKSVYRPADD